MPVVRTRVDASVWEEFVAATGGQQAEVIREFCAWYVWRRGAKLPKRPPRAETPDAGGQQSHA